MNILFLAYETEGCGMSSIAQRLQKDGHTVLVAHGDTHNFVNNRSIHDFYQEQGFESWVNYEEEYNKLYNSDFKVDYEFIKKFEENYCGGKNFQQLLLTDPTLRRSHHYREPYYTPTESEELVYYWAELQIRWILEIFDEFSPDLVITFKRNYFIKNITSEIASATNTPMLTLINSRIDNYCHFTRHFGYGSDPDAEPYINGEYRVSDEVRDYIDQFQEADGHTSLYSASSTQKAKNNELYSYKDIIDDFVSGIWGTTKRNVLMRLKKKYRGRIFARNHFDSHTPSLFQFKYETLRRRLSYKKKNILSGMPTNKNFIYFPLHTLPESSTLTLTTEYYETDLINYLSKELPSDYTLAVKENPNMVGLRPLSIYKSLNEHPNVSVIDPLVPSKRLIKKSAGVCGISGTALLESAILATPTLAFGEPEFVDVVDFHGRNEVSEFIEATREAKTANPQKVACYIQYVFDSGEEVPLYKLRNKQHSKEFYEGVDAVYEMIIKNIDRFVS